MIINLPTKRICLSDSGVTNISKTTYKMAAKPASLDMERNYVAVTLCIHAYKFI